MKARAEIREVPSAALAAARAERRRARGRRIERAVTARRAPRAARGDRRGARDERPPALARASRLAFGHGARGRRTVPSYRGVDGPAAARAIAALGPSVVGGDRRRSRCLASWSDAAGADSSSGAWRSRARPWTRPRPPSAARSRHRSPREIDVMLDAAAVRPPGARPARAPLLDELAARTRVAAC